MDAKTIYEAGLATMVFLLMGFFIWRMIDVMIEISPSFAEEAWKIWGIYIGGGSLAIAGIFVKGRMRAAARLVDEYY